MATRMTFSPSDKKKYLLSMKHLLFLAVLLPLPFTGCQKEKQEPDQDRGKLVSYRYITTISPEEIVHNFPEQAEFTIDISGLVRYPVKIYYYEYRSAYLDAPITLSGLIMAPDTAGIFPVCAYMHGTMKPYPMPDGEGSEDLPSLYRGEYPDASWKQGETRLFGSYTASHGYIMVLPDYAGYNVSAQVSHPYTQHRELGMESVDAILAAQVLLQRENIQTSGKTFLSGWSEGAGAALAAQREIESRLSDRINLIASASLAGPYDMQTGGELAVLAPLSSWEWDPNELEGILWSLYATNHFSKNPIPADKLFQFEVSSEYSVLKERPGNIPSRLLRTFVTGNEAIKEQFRQNDVARGWAPRNKVILYYGTEDANVFPFNSENAYREFRKQGCDVTLMRYAGDDHYTPALKYYTDMITRFDLLK